MVSPSRRSTTSQAPPERVVPVRAREVRRRDDGRHGDLRVCRRMEQTVFESGLGPPR